jgi:L-2-hydroxycarboxylate dehydrogenase (NAD+)
MGEWIMPGELHDRIVAAAYKKRGYTGREASQAAQFSNLTARHGIKTHNAIKALHLDELFGSKAGGCVPGAAIDKIKSPYRAVQRWNANRKLGQAVGLEAMAAAMKLADRFGIGAVAVDNAFHYLWGGGYVIDAAKKGYIAYTNCTAALAEVVPFGGKFPTLGTNPHSWGFPTSAAIGYPICIDWATSSAPTRATASRSSTSWSARSSAARCPRCGAAGTRARPTRSAPRRSSSRRSSPRRSTAATSRRSARRR